MKKTLLRLSTLLATVLVAVTSASGYAHTPLIKISAAIYAGETPLASSNLVTKNNEAAIIKIGKGPAPAAGKPPQPGYQLDLNLQPSLQPDGTINMAVDVKTSETEIVDQQPDKHVRSLKVVLKLAAGKQASMDIPNPANQKAMRLTVTADVLSETALAAANTMANKKEVD